MQLARKYAHHTCFTRPNIFSRLSYRSVWNAKHSFEFYVSGTCNDNKHLTICTSSGRFWFAPWCKIWDLCEIYLTQAEFFGALFDFTFPWYTLPKFEALVCFSEKYNCNFELNVFTVKTSIWAFSSILPSSLSSFFGA